MGVAVHQLASFTFDHPAPAGLILGYGAVPTGDVDEALRRLGAAFGAEPER